MSLQFHESSYWRAGASTRVLVVDDDEVCRAVARETLEEGGFDVMALVARWA